MRIQTRKNKGVFKLVEPCWKHSNQLNERLSRVTEAFLFFRQFAELDGDDVSGSNKSSFVSEG